MRTSKAPAFYAGRASEKLGVKREALRRRLTKIARRPLFFGGWTTKRDYAFYNTVFEHGLRQMNLGENLIDALARLKPSREQLRILEDGAGKGVALSQIKQELEKKGVQTHTTALTLVADWQLKKRYQTLAVDELVEGMAEDYSPKHSLSAIVSVFGSATYTLPEARRDHILKFVHSLSPRGLFLMCFYLDPAPKKGVITSLSPNQKNRRPADTPKQMGAIRQSLQKQGFRAEFFPFQTKRREVGIYYPNTILIVQRINSPKTRQK